MKTVVVPFSERCPNHSCGEGGGSQSDAHAAIDYARTLARSWPSTHPETRAVLVSDLARLLASRVGTLAELMAREIGKPVCFGRVEIERTAEMVCAVVRRPRGHGERTSRWSCQRETASAR